MAWNPLGSDSLNVRHSTDYTEELPKPAKSRNSVNVHDWHFGSRTHRAMFFLVAHLS